jgi:hypothetical protein
MHMNLLAFMIFIQLCQLPLKTQQQINNRSQETVE